MLSLNRSQLQEAIARISAQDALFSEATVATILEILQDRLTSLEEVDGSGGAATPAIEQRKQVTILFAAIDGFTRLPGTARNTARLQQIDILWQRLDEAILDHGGLVDKHMGDVIMGIFGAPVAREDDPERAVRCAMTLRELIEEFLAEQSSRPNAGDSRSRGAGIRIGINTGQVILGSMGSDLRPTAIGDSVNVASRLREAAEEPGIYISQDTYRLIRGLFRVEPLGEVSIKGRQMPVTAHRVLGELPRLFFPVTEGVGGIPVPMIGREKEMTALKSLLVGAARDGRGGVITLVGDAGVGKSRLVREFHRQLDEFPFKLFVLQARTDQRLAGVPFSLMRDLLTRCFNIEDGDDANRIEEKIMNGLRISLENDGSTGQRSHLRERARAIGLLVGLDLPSRHPEPWERGGVGAIRERAIEAILEFLDAAIHNAPATVMVLEDIHWADEDSLALLERMAAGAADRPLLMLCLTRPTFLERRPRWPGEEPVGALSLPVRPLDDRGSRDLVLSILRRLPDSPPSLVDLIIRSAAGNPYYVEELVRVLIEDGIIVTGQDDWYFRPRELIRMRVPATLTGVLQARLDRLPEPERAILQQAAVIGDEFWTGAVQSLNQAARFPFPEEQIIQTLNSLEQRDMIVRSASAASVGSGSYLFRHTLLREVAYESVLLRDRPGYHLQAARWLESQRSDRSEDYAAPVARHYEQAGRPAEAARMFMQAATRATDQFKLPAAIDFYRRALDLLRSLPQHLDEQLEALERLGRLLWRRGRLIEARDVYRELHDSAGLDGNLLIQARAGNELATVALEMGDAQQAMVEATGAEQSARLTGADIEQIDALILQAKAAGQSGARKSAAEAAHRALELASSLYAPRRFAHASSLTTQYADDTAKRNSALREMRLLAEALAGQGQAEDAAYAFGRLGEGLLALGRPGDAREALAHALVAQHDGGDRGELVELLRLDGLAACRLGDAGVALSLLEKAESLADESGDRYLRLACRLAAGEVLLARGELAAAEATLRQVITAAENRQRLGNWAQLISARALLVEALNRQGRTDEARLAGFATSHQRTFTDSPP